MKPNKRLALFLCIAFGLFTIIVALSSLFCLLYHWWLSKRRGSQSFTDNDLGNQIPTVSYWNQLGTAEIEYTSLEKGSDNFANGNLLGVGGFGRVYKASLDFNTIVAVKKLNCVGEDTRAEFENEVDLLGKTRHPNIIAMVGYSVHEDMGFVVYELMPNGSLEDQLHGPSHGRLLSWHRRLKIALDTARGLEYLHEFCNPSVIHRDLKSSNILLDSNFNAKVSDFGLAVANTAKNQTKLKLSGTVGYVAPEYILNGTYFEKLVRGKRNGLGELTEKSDVYAYGVVLLELLLGRKAIEKVGPPNSKSIVTWAMPHLTNRNLLPRIVDPVIKGIDVKYLLQVAAVAVLCVQPEPTYRPMITDVVHSLVPLVPFELGGTWKSATCRSSYH